MEKLYHYEACFFSSVTISNYIRWILKSPFKFWHLFFNTDFWVRLSQKTSSLSNLHRTITFYARLDVKSVCACMSVSWSSTDRSLNKQSQMRRFLISLIMLNPCFVNWHKNKHQLMKENLALSSNIHPPFSAFCCRCLSAVWVTAKRWIMLYKDLLYRSSIFLPYAFFTYLVPHF